MAGPYDRVMFHGQRVTRRQKAALREVERAARVEFICTRGSWESYSDSSGTTHMGAGVCDLWLPGMSTDGELRRRVTRVLRRTGCQAAFCRGPGALGGFPWHWHVCDLDTRGMDGNAVWQVAEYRAGHDGLVAGREDPFAYRPDPIVPFDYARWVREQTLRQRIADLTHDIRVAARRRAEARARLEALRDV